MLSVPTNGRAIIFLSKKPLVTTISKLLSSVKPGHHYLILLNFIEVHHSENIEQDGVRDHTYSYNFTRAERSKHAGGLRGALSSALRIQAGDIDLDDISDRTMNTSSAPKLGGLAELRHHGDLNRRKSSHPTCFLSTKHPRM